MKPETSPHRLRLTSAMLVLALVSAVTASAQDVVSDPVEEPPRRYAVEVIVFIYEEAVSVGNEVFIPELPPELERLDDEGRPLELGDAASGLATELAEAAQAAEDVVIEYPPIDLQLMTEEESSMGGILRKFELLDVYETLFHAGWSQSVHDDTLTLPLDMNALGRPPAGLEGSFKLYLNRFLHLVVDVSLDAPASEQPRPDPRAENESSFDFPAARSQPPGTVRYRIAEDRIFKNGDLRYFDHPKFGVLARVTRIETEDEDAGMDGPDLPLN